MTNLTTFDGILKCSKYSFGPNRLHYCGPDQNIELSTLIKAGALVGDKGFGLSSILKEFKTLFPYLKHIANSNQITDPFDKKVVEAYWLGNSLLEKIEKQKFYDFLIDDLNMKKKKSLKDFLKLSEKVSTGVPHHNFHVLNIWTKMGHNDKLSAISRMNECRISSGEVISVSGPEIIVKTEPLVMLANGKIQLSKPILRTITRKFEVDYDIEQLMSGQIISIHWGVPCEVISKKQADILKKYTLKSIDLTNN